MKKKLSLFYCILMALIAITMHIACNKKKEVLASDVIGSVPAVEKVFPGKGAAGGTIVIDGSHFSKTPEENLVFFDGIPATVLSATDRTLTVTIPEKANSGKLTVNVGETVLTVTANFEIDPSAPVVTSFSPAKLQAGETLTIYGQRFTPATKIIFGDAEGENVQWVNDGTITVVVPKKAVRGKLQAVNEKATALSARSFFPRHVVESFSPVRTEQGSEITITGYGFSPVKEENEICFGTLQGKATPEDIISVSPTEIVVRAPKAGKNGSVSVGIDGEHTKSEQQFTYMSHLDDYYPKRGRLLDTITITGNHFGDNPYVKINGSLCRVVKVTDSTLSFLMRAEWDIKEGQIAVRYFDKTEHGFRTKYQVINEWHRLYASIPYDMDLFKCPSFNIENKVYFVLPEAKMLVYDVSTNAWTKQTMPASFFNFYYGTAVSYRGKAFFGLASNKLWYEYDPKKADPWVKLPDYQQGAPIFAAGWGAMGRIFIGPGVDYLDNALNFTSTFNFLDNVIMWYPQIFPSPNYTPNTLALSFVLNDRYAYILGGQRCINQNGCKSVESMTRFDSYECKYSFSYGHLDVSEFNITNSSTFVFDNVGYINAKGQTYAYNQSQDRWKLLTDERSSMNAETIASYIINNKIYGFDLYGEVYEYQTDLKENSF